MSMSFLPWAVFQVLAQQPTPSMGEFLLSGVAPIALIFAIFYFLLLRPARKRQHDLANVVSNLKRGDRVVTNGGIYGDVASVENETIFLRIADNVKIRVAKSAIAGLEASAEKGVES